MGFFSKKTNLNYFLTVHGGSGNDYLFGGIRLKINYDDDGDDDLVLFE